MLLADGNVHSGQKLGDALGVSRAAICKQIKRLNALGLDVASTKGEGYRLSAPLELLELSCISRNLDAEVKKLLPEIDICWSIASTNGRCLSAIKNKLRAGYVCLTEHQSAGRGRRGRSWVSPLAGGLYLSLVWQFTGGAEVLEGLSLAVAIAVATTLREKHFLDDVKLKWPNDILFGDKKIGGILIEVVGEAGGPCSVVVGIGLNVKASTMAECEIDQLWTDLSSASGESISRNQLAASILNSLIPLLQGYEYGGFTEYRKRWARYDAYEGKRVVIHHGRDEYIEGVVCGISESGELLLEVNGCKRTFKSGEVSLRYV
jgi:BirA family transcriptional regulator, biotin operon repressor / biotin---[acetyl-CoA-carboxylase] ligase